MSTGEAFILVRISQLDVPKCSVGEGPVWDCMTQALYWIDILGMRVYRLSFRSGEITTWEVPDIIGSLAILDEATAVVALRTGVYRLDLAGGGCEPLATSGTLDRRVQLADGKVDRAGRFVVGSSDRKMREPLGRLYSCAPGAQWLRELDDGFILSNGPCWSPDGSVLYHADSHRNVIYAYDYDLTSGDATHRRVFACTDDLGGIPDGATVDREGGVWSAICEGGKLVRYRPDGSLDCAISMPVQLPSSVMFGGPGLDLLFVPSIDPTFLGRPSGLLDGGLFVVEGLDVQGVPESRFGDNTAV